MIDRVDRDDAEVVADLVRLLEQFAAAPPDRDTLASACREAASQLQWSGSRRAS